MSHRKLYKSYYGSIPVDKDGRTYDIHHIDGNRKNNAKKNLIALPIEEHYQIHLNKKEFRAAHAILLRMKYTPEEFSELASKAAKERVQLGKNPLLGGKIQREYNRKKVEDGTHHFLSEKHSKNVSERNKKLTDQGLHNFQSIESRESVKERNRISIENGTHSFKNGVGAKSSRDRVKDGTHHFLNNEKQKKLSLKSKAVCSIKVEAINTETGDILFFDSMSDLLRQMPKVSSKKLNLLKENEPYMGYTWKLIKPLKGPGAKIRGSTTISEESTE